MPSALAQEVTMKYQISWLWRSALCPSTWKTFLTNLHNLGGFTHESRVPNPCTGCLAGTNTWCRPSQSQAQGISTKMFRPYIGQNHSPSISDPNFCWLLVSSLWNAACSGLQFIVGISTNVSLTPTKLVGIFVWHRHQGLNFDWICFSYTIVLPTSALFKLWPHADAHALHYQACSRLRWHLQIMRQPELRRGLANWKMCSYSWCCSALQRGLAWEGCCRKKKNRFKFLQGDSGCICLSILPYLLLLPFTETAQQVKFWIERWP